MKVTFDKQKLIVALTAAAGISQVKNTLTTIEGLLFECPPSKKFGEYDGEDKSVCRISAYDLEKGLRTIVECNVFEEGVYIINTGKILQIVRALPDGEIMLEVDEKNKVTVSGGHSSFEITAANGVDFPAMPMLMGDRVFTLPQYLVRNKIEETVFAVAANDLRPAFNGALFKLKNGELTIVGCDGNRLAASRCSLMEAGVPDAELIIPGKFLIELSKMLKDSEEDVTIILSRKHIIFKMESSWFFTRIIEAEYMDYEKALPKSYMTQVFVNRRDMIAAVERASVITEDKLGGNARPPVLLTFSNGFIEISSVSQGGSVYEKVACAMEGADLTIAFTCRLLLDSLKGCPDSCDTLRIRLNRATTGVVIEPAEGSGFVEAEPDPAVFGEAIPREWHSDGSNPDASENSSEEDAPRCLYFVMPRRL